MVPAPHHLTIALPQMHASMRFRHTDNTLNVAHCNRDAARVDTLSTQLGVATHHHLSLPSHASDLVLVHVVNNGVHVRLRV